MDSTCPRTREADLTELVAILREATAKMTADTSHFRGEVLSSADRLKTMNHLDDIRELKQRLSNEISLLERTVELQKQCDRSAIEKLAKRVDVLQPDLALAEKRTLLDPLTKLANRTGFDLALANMIASAGQSSSPLTLAMLDVDDFKSINETHGHLVGDQVLLCMADWLRGSLRQDDVIVRYGGEEFAVLIGIGLKQAEARFASVLASIADRSYDDDYDHGNVRPKDSVRFTVSCGLAQFTDGDTADDLLSRADQALYDAKHKGGNCVCARKVSRLARLLAR